MEFGDNKITEAAGTVGEVFIAFETDHHVPRKSSVRNRQQADMSVCTVALRFARRDEPDGNAGCNHPAMQLPGIDKALRAKMQCQRGTERIYRLRIVPPAAEKHKVKSFHLSQRCGILPREQMACGNRKIIFLAAK